MSKRQSNTLFNYFPSSAKVPPKIPEQEVQPDPNLKAEQQSDDSNDDVVFKRKRSRIIAPDTDSDSENESPNKQTPQRKPRAKENKSQSKKRRVQSESDSLDDTIDTPRKSLKDFSFSSARTTETENGQSSFTPQSPESQNAAEPAVDIHSNWQHNTLDFLKPEHIRDAQKRRPNHPDYDPGTLYVPLDFLNAATPGMRQWWVLKSAHMDAILFFKVGKFYELYHMDAVVGVQQLGFTYMKSHFAHSGFPESAYGKMASALIQKGFKVARVEQTETPQMMTERCKTQRKVTKFDKVVNREICQVSTKATCVYSAQMPDAQQAMPCYLYALSEKTLPNGNVRFGVCFVDTSIGTFHLSEFVDDKHCSRLLAMFAANAPGLLLTERGAAYPYLQRLHKTHFKNINKETLASKSQFYTAETTLEKLRSGCYFRVMKEDQEDDVFEWPTVFKQLADDCLPRPQYELTLKCLGACMWYLKNSEIDIQVLSMRKFEIYDPIDLNSSTSSIDELMTRKMLLLDSGTLSNLNLLGGNGTLQKTLDYCGTAFGRRLLLNWICQPMCNHDRIKMRQEAVMELYDDTELLAAARTILKKLPDLERQVSKIHSYGNRFCAKDHPDSRAIFYEAVTYSKRKIMDLIKTLNGFEQAQKFADMFKGCESRLLQQLTQFDPIGLNVDLADILKYFKGAFNHDEAAKNGNIIPQPGVVPDYDKAGDAIKDIQLRLNEYLKEQSKFFGCQVTYFGSDKKRFQLEVPEVKSNQATSEYLLEGTKRGNKPAKRYSTAKSKALLAAMLVAESTQSKILLDVNRQVFENFSKSYDKWETAVSCISILDVLCSLAEYARTCSHEICMPNIEPFSETPFIKIEGGRHPCVSNVHNFVPNDTEMGRENFPPLLIITGPNMGGKSTLMRQVAVIAIMAHMGSCVPAKNCSISLIDRIFTRLGAEDDIMKGMSTFFMELSEASAILQHATSHSLVLLDELGRGTSTHDGNAIATAYVRKLTEKKCRVLFSTHYHTLVDQFIGRDDVQLGHMACMVEEDDATEESVTFLYKMWQGICPKSYGFNAAKLAGLKGSIIARAKEIAADLEREVQNRNAFGQIFNGPVDEIRKVLRSIKL